MHPSDSQKPAIAERDCDVLVVAGAGTGKTLTLVARYLSLLAEGIPLRSVVAITFTKKAAWEMRNRVRAEIDRYLRRADLTAVERSRWRDIYTATDAARIATIHSLCTEMLRTHPAAAGVDPRFAVLEEAHATIQMRRAAEVAMAWAAEQDHLVPLFALLGEKRLHEVLDFLLHRRLDVQPAFAELPDDPLSAWQQQLSAYQERAVETLCGSPEWIATVGMLEEQSALVEDDKAELQRRFALDCIRRADDAATRGDDIAARLAALAGLNSIGLRGGRQGNWPGGKEQLELVKEALELLRTRWREHKYLLALTMGPVDDQLASCLPLLKDVFDFAERQYTQYKESHNVLDFDDLEGKALAMLAGNPAVRVYWQQEIGSVLVDEFQDTNRRQRDLLSCICVQAGRLFVVGDAKQSIYRFRGADITVFRAERQRIGQEAGIALSLDTSYRAHGELLSGLNSLLSPVLGEEDATRPWVEPFAPLSHHRLQPGPGFCAPYIEMHLAIGTKNDGALDTAARALADRLVYLVESGTCEIMDQGQRRPLHYGDIAILCRASTSFAAYENALEGRAPFLTVAGRGFYGRPEIRDLLNALRALADPTDDLALVGLLRSPACGLSDVALYRLRSQADGASLWHELQRVPTPLEAECDAATRAVQLIHELHAQVGRIPVALLLKQLLDRAHYRAALLQSGSKRGALNVSKLLADAHSSGIVSVGEFLEYIAGVRDSGAREGEARDTSEGAIQIMSVHAAKGLEFPVVVIGDVTHARHSVNGPLVDTDLGVLLPVKAEEGTPAAIYSLGKLREDDQDAAESARLFYVAATRAREMLILSGYVGRKDDGALERMGGWLEPLVEPLGLDEVRLSEYDPEGHRARSVDLAIGASPLSCTVYEPSYAGDSFGSRRDTPAAHPQEAVPALVQRIELAEEDPSQSAGTESEEHDPPRRVWRVVPSVQRPRAPAWVIGSIVHEALASWRFPDHTFALWAEARAHQYGVTDARQLQHAARESARLLRRFQRHALCGEMDSAERRLHEVPYSLEVNGRVENGTIDALYFRDGHWTIVEFKTDTVRTVEGIEQLLSETDYRTQTQRYVLAVEQLLGVTPRAVLCLLDCERDIRVESGLHSRSAIS